MAIPIKEQKSTDIVPIWTQQIANFWRLFLHIHWNVYTSFFFSIFP